MQKVITSHCMCADSYQLKMATQLEQSSKQGQGNNSVFERKGCLQQEIRQLVEV
jgi:hypothetical protein